MLIMGWHGRKRNALFALGSTIDPVIERAPTDVVILKNCGGNKVFRRVLVPLAGGPNGALALEIAGMLADSQQGEITAFTVRRGGGSFNLEAFVEQCADRIRLPADRVQTRTVGGKDVVESILAEAEDYDLVVLGNTAVSRLSRMARDPVPETVARRIDKPVVMARASGGVRNWVRRWI
jgi:nucleotide-binding universal stress UspA family protein